MPKRRPRVRVPPLEAIRGETTPRVAVDLFMKAVRELKSKILNDFAESVPSVISPGKKAPPARKSPEYVAWAQRWELESPYVFGWALRTRTEWKHNPKSLRDRTWTNNLFTAIRLDRRRHNEVPSTQFLQNLDPAEPLEAYPDVENERQFLDRAKKHWAARVNQGWDVERLHEVDTPPAEREFRWLAQYHVARESFSQIAKAERVKHETVAAGVKRAALILDIKIRPPRAGRPPARRSTTE